MRVLFSTSLSAHFMPPPQLGDEQVNCGPEWPDDFGTDGRVRSLRTPVGSFDLGAVASRLPRDQQPDLVVCHLDPTWRSQPRNLGAFKCPRIALVADTHHMNFPLVSMCAALAREPYDRTVLLYCRHHASLFKAAGVNNLFWFPGLTFYHTDVAVAAARAAAQRETRIGFVGQWGNFHPRRTRLLAALRQSGLPLCAEGRLPEEVLPFYGRSLLGFNASLNGDLNLRVFEIMAAGAALLTDRLAPSAGLESLFADHQVLTTYSGADDLVAEAGRLLANPEVSLKMGEAGSRWFDCNLAETVRRRDFLSLAFDGRQPTRFNFDGTGRTYLGGARNRLEQSLPVYQVLQDLHRKHEHVSVVLDSPDTMEEIAEICASLPRIQVMRNELGAVADMMIFSSDRAGQVELGAVEWLWCWDAAPAELGLLAARFAPQGYSPASSFLAVFRRTPPPAVAVISAVPPAPSGSPPTV